MMKFSYIIFQPFMSRLPFFSMTCPFYRIFIKSKLLYTLTSSSRKCSSQAILKPEISGVAERVPKLSTLFVPGRKGGLVYQIVKPFVDADYLKHNLDLLKKSCDHRGIELDLDYTLKLTDEWIILKNYHSSLAQKYDECVEEINHVESSCEQESLSALKQEKEKLILKIHAEKCKIYDLEDTLMPLLQNIPHLVHPTTPILLNIIEASKEPVNKNIKKNSHLKIADSMINIPLNSSMHFFLSGKLAQLEFAIQNYFLEKLCMERFIPLSCADFCKSFVIEAVGSNPHGPNDCLTIKEKKSSTIGQKLHLVGGASLESLCAYLTNMNITKNNLPCRYFSIGRHYNAANSRNKLLDLFSLVQSVNAHTLVISNKSVENDFDSFLKFFLSCYSELDVPVRTVQVSVKNLNVTESRRTELKIWAPSLKDYVSVAYVSQHDDFISKRLHITYGEEVKKEGYCNMVEGTVCNIPVIIGCIVENFYSNENDFDIPDVLKSYMVL